MQFFADLQVDQHVPLVDFNDFIFEHKHALVLCRVETWCSFLGLLRQWDVVDGLVLTFIRRGRRTGAVRMGLQVSDRFARRMLVPFSREVDHSLRPAARSTRWPCDFFSTSSDGPQRAMRAPGSPLPAGRRPQRGRRVALVSKTYRPLSAASAVNDTAAGALGSQFRDDVKVDVGAEKEGDLAPDVFQTQQQVPTKHGHCRRPR